MAEILGASEWSRALRLYEWMQPEEDVAEDEWRIVQHRPFRFNSDLDERAELVDEALGVAKTWGISSIDIEPDDLLCILCPQGERRTIRAELPEEFRQIRISTHGPSRHARELLRGQIARFMNLFGG